MSRVTQKQIRLLTPFLEGDHPTHTNVDQETGEVTREWNLRCPLHGDERRSASLNVDKGVFWCAVCGGMSLSTLIRRHDEWIGASDNGYKNVGVNAGADEKQKRTLYIGKIARW